MTLVEQWVDEDTVLIIDRVDSATLDLPREERPYVLSMTRPRLREFAAGRTAARRAMELLQHPQGFGVPMGENGEPIWPPSVTGSISHTTTHAAALVAKSVRHASVGVDLDDGRLLGAKAAADLMTDDEVMAVLAQGWTHDASIAQNIAFMAKEALFKYQYPLTGRRELDFDHVRLRTSQRAGVLAASCMIFDADVSTVIDRAEIYFEEIQKLRVCWVLPTG